ncbi:MAG: phosphate/phosphite/phosphonate ABC transporter substrate-binding protein [Gammaproteobacteria bacterium]|nr:phosphate/phosphite/phosphonate ABC transporter substrate-binding protein [Gammaproteobacteria bacterium]
MRAALFTLIYPIRGVAVTLLLLLPLHLTAESLPLQFGVVPQQSARKLAEDWGPMLAYIEQTSGIHLRFATAPSIPEFEKRVAAGDYAFAYMNPYHYTVFSKSPGFRAIANARDSKINGIMVTRKDAPYQQLEALQGLTLAFPAPAAFAATILQRATLRNLGVATTPKFVSSHDSVYRAVAAGLYPAGGGIMRTFNALTPEIRDQLRILSTTPGYTPHAIAVHPTVDSAMAAKVQRAFIALEESEEGRQLLQPMKIKGWQAATDADWDDVRALNIDLLDNLIESDTP